MDGALNALQECWIVAARVPARAWPGVGDAVYDAVAPAFASGVRIVARELKRLADEMDSGGLRIVPADRAIDAVEELLRVRVIGMLVALNVVVKDGVQAELVRPVDDVIDVCVALGCGVDVLDEDINGRESCVQDSVELPVRKVINGAT